MIDLYEEEDNWKPTMELKWVRNNDPESPAAQIQRWFDSPDLFVLKQKWRLEVGDIPAFETEWRDIEIED